MAGTYRYWLICLPSIDADGLVLFTENDHDGGMIRDYSTQGKVREARRVLLDDVPGVFLAATKRFSVHPHKVTDHSYWWNEIQRFSVELQKTTEPSHWGNEIQKGSVGACPAPTTSFFERSASSGLKGSKYHIQRWVNEYAQELQHAIGDAFPLVANWPLRWVSPLVGESCREYQDSEFLQAIGLDRLSSDLAAFWPAGGPQWDALAVLEPPRVGVILIEAKAYPGEAENRRCRAEGASRRKISERLDGVKAKLGADLTADWMGSRYQVANRLAHLCFLRDHGVSAWYLQICFCDDVTHRPTTAECWREALPGLWRDLGLSTIPTFVADLLLPARDCDAEKVDSWAASCLVSFPSIPTRDRSGAPLRHILDDTDPIINNTLGIPLSGSVKQHAERSFDRWIETLPFPLASILRAWLATPGQDFKTKYEHLIHFFEATAEFVGIVFLSAFSSNESLFQLHRQKLTAAIESVNLTYSRPTFGLWKLVVEYLGKQTRDLLKGGEERKICVELFADPSLSLPTILSRTGFASILATANKMRNDWTGHGGVVGKEEAQLRNHQLLAELQSLREGIGRMLTSLIVSAWAGYIDRNSFRFWQPRHLINSVQRCTVKGELGRVFVEITESLGVSIPHEFREQLLGAVLGTD